MDGKPGGERLLSFGIGRFGCLRVLRCWFVAAWSCAVASSAGVSVGRRILEEPAVNRGADGWRQRVASGEDQMQEVLNGASDIVAGTDGECYVERFLAVADRVGFRNRESVE